MIKSFCDRCGKETEKLKNIKISVGNPNYYTASDYIAVSVEICEECQKQTGVLDFLENHRYSKKPIEQSAQEKFFELFRDMVAESVQDLQ